MPLHATTLAMYESKEGKNLLSSSQVSSHGLGDIRLEKSETVEVGWSVTSIRTALLRVLTDIAAFRVQYADISTNSPVVMPHSVVFGFKELHNSAGYQSLIQNAFPEYFSCRNQFTSTDDCLDHLLSRFQREHTLKEDSLGQRPILLQHPFALFLPEQDDDKLLHKPAAVEQQFSLLLARLIHLAENGTAGEKEKASQGLVAQAKKDAREYADSLRERGILDQTRFVQFGPHTNAFRDCTRYTYLAHGNLRDIFVWELIQQFKEQHNVCLKTPADTPKDKPSPAFVDIAATFLQDAEMWIYYYRNNTTAEFRSVFAQKITKC